MSREMGERKRHGIGGHGTGGTFVFPPPRSPNAGIGWFSLELCCVENTKLGTMAGKEVPSTRELSAFT